jgi:hypothetical protein
MKPLSKTPLLDTKKSPWLAPIFSVFDTAKILSIGSVRNWIKKQQSAQEVSHG